MISMRMIRHLIEVYEDFGLDGLKQEIRDLKLHTDVRCKVSEIVKLVLSEI